ncbi:DNA repair protein Rad50, eukaryotes [Kipferlia bialata]|uniref:DNA repair protein Rad50, eukaryotes n=1 Tax=Kipferlia bialata TaxID=797122 RepID=A0A9K3CTH1_9EUKA|nr:DNA repair protein Rad50, eukaryotes [Kipferlia bialata]|eukprot:g3145.t1
MPPPLLHHASMRLSAIEAETQTARRAHTQALSELSSLEPQLQAGTDRLTRAQSDRTEAQHQLDSAHQLVQMMEPMISLHQLKDQYRRVKAEYDTLRQEVGQEGADTGEGDTQQLQQTVQDLQYTKGKTDQTVEALHTSIREKTRAVLRAKPACERHNHLVRDVIVHQSVQTDLRDLVVHIDAAVIEFHTAKMEEVNDTLKELWRTTYTATDILYIYLHSSGATMTGRRKTYSYCLMMGVRSPGGEIKSIPMRGRCSAGQRVMASILVRVALSVTFGSECAMLCLDEPTTNLDAANAESLAGALHRLIQTRLRSAAFQLVLITHDKRFIRHLQCHRLGVDHVYEVSKREGGHSRITRRDLATLDL